MPDWAVQVQYSILTRVNPSEASIFTTIFCGKSKEYRKGPDLFHNKYTKKINIINHICNYCRTCEVMFIIPPRNKHKLDLLISFLKAMFAVKQRPAYSE